MNTSLNCFFTVCMKRISQLLFNCSMYEHVPLNFFFYCSIYEHISLNCFFTVCMKLISQLLFNCHIYEHISLNCWFFYCSIYEHVISKLFFTVCMKTYLLNCCLYCMYIWTSTCKPFYSNMWGYEPAYCSFYCSMYEQEHW